MLQTEETFSMRRPCESTSVHVNKAERKTLLRRAHETTYFKLTPTATTAYQVS